MQHPLVGGNVALDPRDRALVALPDLLRNLVDEAHVVADKHDSSLETLYRIRKRVDSLNVEVVRGLIQKQNVWGLCGPAEQKRARVSYIRGWVGGWVVDKGQQATRIVICGKMSVRYLH